MQLKKLIQNIIDNPIFSFLGAVSIPTKITTHVYFQTYIIFTTNPMNGRYLTKAKPFFSYAHLNSQPFVN